MNIMRVKLLEIRPIMLVKLIIKSMEVLLKEKVQCSATIKNYKRNKEHTNHISVNKQIDMQGVKHNFPR